MFLLFPLLRVSVNNEDKSTSHKAMPEVPRYTKNLQEAEDHQFLGRNIILVRELTSLIRRITEVESCPILFGNRLYTLWIAARCFQMLENKGSRPEYFFQSYTRRNLIERVIFIMEWSSM